VRPVVVVVAFIQSGGHKTKHINYMQEYSPNESQYSKQPICGHNHQHLWIQS